MDAVMKERHLRYVVALWVFTQCGKCRIVSLAEIEAHFDRYCEHILMEFVVLGWFNSCPDGWYIASPFAKFTTSDFQKELKKHYDCHEN